MHDAGGCIYIFKSQRLLRLVPSERPTIVGAIGLIIQYLDRNLQTGFVSFV